MSDALTPDAPVEDAAATAPAPDTAAEVGSVDSPEVVPATRFNGLMAKYNADKAAFEAERAALRAELERLQSAEEEAPYVSDDVISEVQALRAELAAERRGNALARAIEKYPEAAPFADLIRGDTVSEIEAMASELASRMQGLSPAPQSGDAPAADENAAPPAAEAPEVPTLGGAVTVDDTAATDEVIASAVATKDFSALWSGLNRRAQERAQAQGAELTVG